MIMAAISTPTWRVPGSCSPERRCPIGPGSVARTPCATLAASSGGTWMNALAGDLGNGIFDGAHLVANFESLNPANTSIGPRYLQRLFQGRYRNRAPSWSSRPGGATRCC